MSKFINISALIIIGLLLMSSCGRVNENQEKTSKQTKDAEELFGSFIKEDSFPVELTTEYLSHNYWRGIDYNTIYRFIDTDLRKYNKMMQKSIDSLSEINEHREIYDPLETQYDEKYWDDEDLDYIYNGIDYRGVRSFSNAQNFTILLYMKVDKDAYYDTFEFIAGPLILATHQVSTGERIDSIQIDYHQLIESLEEETGHLKIRESGVSMKYGEVEKTIKIDNEGNFVKK